VILILYNDLLILFYFSFSFLYSYIFIKLVFLSIGFRIISQDKIEINIFLLVFLLINIDFGVFI